MAEKGSSRSVLARGVRIESRYTMAHDTKAIEELQQLPKLL